MQEAGSLPPVFIPEQAAVSELPGDRPRVFLYTPQLDREIKKVLGLRPQELTYRWAYHPGQRLYVLLLFWPLASDAGVEAGVAIPEGAGDPLLDVLAGGAELYLTLQPVAGTGGERLSADQVQELLSGLTVHLPEVRYRGRPRG